MRKSKEEKLIEQRLAVTRTISKMQQFVAELTPKRELFVQKAKEARLKGAAGQERAAKAALKQVMSQQRLAEQMLLNFEIMANLRDLTEMSGEFMKGMSQMSKQMSKMTANMNFKDSEKEFNKAMLKSQVQTDKMNEFLEKMSMTMDAGFEDAGGVTDAEIDSIIGFEAASQENELDTEIEAKLAKLSNLQQ